MNKTWKVKGKVMSFTEFEEEFHIGEMRLYPDDDGIICFENIVAAASEKEALELTIKSFEEKSRILSFVTDSRFDLIITQIFQIGDKEQKKYGAANKPGSIVIIKEITREKLEAVKTLLDSFSHLDSISHDALRYYCLGIAAEEWRAGAFIHYFNVIELIADTYKDQGKEFRAKENKCQLKQTIEELEKEINGQRDERRIIKLARKICDLTYVGPKLKIKLAINDFDLKEFEPDTVDNLVDTRHGVAHPREQGNPVGPSELELCKSLAKALLNAYIEKQIAGVS